MNTNQSHEWLAAAEWCAKRNLKGTFGDPLPMLISVSVVSEINENQEQFEAEVRLAAYAIARGNR